MANGPQPNSDDTIHFDSGLLTDTEGLHLVARKITSGSLAGLHRSPRRGASIEFSEHKLYTPGDDVRHIDWRAFAKTDRLHVKQFEDETNLRIELLHALLDDRIQTANRHRIARERRCRQRIHEHLSKVDRR